MARVHGKASTYTNGKCRCEDCRAAVREYQREWNARNREHVRAYKKANGMKDHRRRQYGIEDHQYQERVTAQRGCCAICGEQPVLLHVDHDHATNQVRGLLCNGCNRGLGFFNDDPERLRAAAGYLAGDAVWVQQGRQ